MKKRVFLGLLLLILSKFTTFANQPDSAYVFTYTNDARANGLHFAWSIDKTDWHAIGPEYTYIMCDYGRWGAEKKMFSPYLFQAIDGLWHCIWSVNYNDGVFAHASSNDLVNWGRQSYLTVIAGKNCLKPEISQNKTTHDYTISWISTTGIETMAYSANTKDFKTYSVAKNTPLSDRINQRTNVLIAGDLETGVVTKVPWSIIDGLIKTQQLSSLKNQVYSENYTTDSVRLGLIKPLEAKIALHIQATKKISDLLFGVFFRRYKLFCRWRIIC
jgi:hypothetical protein